MAILSFDTNQKSNDRPFGDMTSVGTGGNQQQKNSKLWMNPGFAHGDKFVSLPFGLAIDTMNKRQIRGGNAEFNAQMQAGNDFLDNLIKAGFNRLAPGEWLNLLEFLPNMELRLQRANEAAEIAAAENEFSVDMSALFA